MIAGTMLILLASFFIGTSFGWQLKNLRLVQLERWAAAQIAERERMQDDGTDLYKIMSQFSNYLEGTVKELYEHEKGCRCAYCEIKRGKPAEIGPEVAHANYVRAVTEKIKGLQTENADLRAELQRRDIPDARRRLAMHSADQYGQSITYQEERDGRVIQTSVTPRLSEDQIAYLYQTKVANLQNQRPMVAEKNQ